MASHPIYQFYAELLGYEPKIWRRFQVMNNISVARLAYILMTLFEMTASHLYSVNILWQKNLKLAFPDWEDEYFENKPEIIPFTRIYDFFNAEDDDREYLEASDHKLKRWINRENEELNFEYDFGDGWELNVKLERIFEDKELPGRELPRVLAGEGFGIVEDCGGTRGLTNLREAFRQKSGEDYELYSTWLGVEDLDVDSFDLTDMNFRLKKIPRIYRDSYEKELQPTERSRKIRDREYKLDEDGNLLW